MTSKVYGDAPLCEADHRYANSNSDANHKNRILRGKRADLWDSVGPVALAPPSGAGARKFERGAGCSPQRVARRAMLAVASASVVCCAYACVVCGRF